MSNEIETNEEDDSQKLVLKKKENTMPGIDPKLFDAAEKQKVYEQGGLGLFAWGLDLEVESEEEPEINVIAKLKHPDQGVPGLNVVRIIGSTVTGTVNIDNIKSVREHENVLVLSAATGLRPELQTSVPEILASKEQLIEKLPQGTPAINGTGILVGIVDYGCDFVHNNFRTDNGTRLLYLWDQNGNKKAPDGYGYGQEYDTLAINQALDSTDPYSALGYQPQEEAHGTHVMDIAAGNGRATGKPGVAPMADLIFVHVSTRDIGSQQTFGDSRHLLEAVDYIFTKAEALGKPAVINISLGTHGGPHDGTTLAEQAFDELLQTPGRAIVMSAGNSWQRKSHAHDTIDVGGKRTIVWEIDQQDKTFNELEIWYNQDHRLDLTLWTIDDQELGPVKLNDTQEITLEND